MGGGTYDSLINEYEQALNDCEEGDNKENCVREAIINFLKETYTSSYDSFKSNFNAFVASTGDEFDQEESIRQYNNFYNQMLLEKNKLVDEINSLDELIKVQSGDSYNYNDVIERRNNEIKSSTQDIEKKNNMIITANEDININKNDKETIYIFGLSDYWFNIITIFYIDDQINQTITIEYSRKFQNKLNYFFFNKRLRIIYLFIFFFS